MASNTCLRIELGTNGRGSPFDTSTMSSVLPMSIRLKLRPDLASLDMRWKSASSGCSTAILCKSIWMFSTAAMMCWKSWRLDSLIGLSTWEIGVVVCS